MIDKFLNMRLKHKLLAICILPFFVQMIFIGEILWKNYEILRQSDRDVQLTYVLELSGLLFKPINIELDLSIMKLDKFDNFVEQDLLKARKSTDEVLGKLKDLLETNFKDSGESGSDIYFQSMINSFNQLASIRDQIDSNSVETKTVVLFFEKLNANIIDDLAEISKEVSDLEVSRSMFAFINLLLEKMSIAKERGLVLQVLQSGEASSSQMITLSRYIGQQEAYKNSLIKLGSNTEDDLHKRAMEKTSVVTSNRIIEKLLNQSDGEKIDIDSKTWWELENEKITTLEAVQNTLISDIRKRIDFKYRANFNEFLLIIGSILVVIPLTIYFLIFSLKKIVKKLQEEIVILSKSGNDIKSSITEAASGTAETATSVTETTTTVEELKQTAEVSAEKAKKVAEVSKEAIEILSTGEKTLESTVEGMLRIQNGMSTISDSIIKLSEHSQSIGKIIDTVNELAEQSHLLAVNAAIEAAKAGEQGKGFSVVAQEVRTLAEQSKQATVQVRSILNDIQNSTSAAVMATEQGTKAVNNGVELSNAIACAMKQLSNGVNKVSDASSQIEQ